MENNDTFTEVTSQSWLSRITGSIKSVLTGLILFLISFIVLWFNEGRAVKTAKGLEEGASNVISVASNSYDKNNSGKLIHTTGKIVTEENLKDDQFNITTKALKLKRTVEMYQWVEKTKKKKEKKIGGGEKTTTTYNYTKAWEKSLIESTNFKRPNGHTNPAQFPYASYTKTVSKATIGDFKVTESLLSKIHNFSSYPIASVDSIKHKNTSIFKDTSNNQTVFIGKGNTTTPLIGDVKISFQTVKSNEDYSIISKQTQNTFEPYNTNTGTKIAIVSKGINSAENMFQTAQENNTMLTWILRFVGFFLMFTGLSLMIKPLVVFADVLPFLGNILEFGLSIFTGIISFGLSFITISIAWVVYRPLVGIPLLLTGLGIIVFVFF